MNLHIKVTDHYKKKGINHKKGPCEHSVKTIISYGCRKRIDFSWNKEGTKTSNQTDLYYKKKTFLQLISGITEDRTTQRRLSK